MTAQRMYRVMLQVTQAGSLSTSGRDLSDLCHENRERRDPREVRGEPPGGDPSCSTRLTPQRSWSGEEAPQVRLVVVVVLTGPELHYHILLWFLSSHSGTQHTDSYQDWGQHFDTTAVRGASQGCGNPDKFQWIIIEEKIELFILFSSLWMLNSSR